jgi:hypothetical protein
MAFAKGKHSKAISDRSGLEFPYVEMVKEWNGMLVHTSEYEPKQPQLDPKPKGSDPQGTDDNNYTFDSGNSANKTVSGGGGSAFAGPVTVVK